MRWLFKKISRILLTKDASGNVFLNIQIPVSNKIEGKKFGILFKDKINNDKCICSLEEEVEFDK